MLQDSDILNAVKGKVECDVNVAASLLEHAVKHRVNGLMKKDLRAMMTTYAKSHNVNEADLEIILKESGPLSKLNGAPAAPVIFSAVELADMVIEPPKWIVPNVLPAGLTILAGKPKSGKSWLAFELAIAAATGGALFDELEVEQSCDVLYLALEDTDYRLQTRMKKLLAGDEEPASLDFSIEWPRIDQDGLDHLSAWIQAHENAGLIVVDTFQHIRSAQKKNGTLYSEDVQALKPLKNLADEHKLAVVVIHHTRKAKAKDSFETVSGSYGLTGTADTIMVLERDASTSNASLKIQGRDVGETEFALRFEKDLARWIYIGECELPATQAQQDVLQAITSEALSPKDIAAKMGEDVKHVSNLLPKLLGKGLIMKAGYGKYISSTYELEQQL